MCLWYVNPLKQLISFIFVTHSETGSMGFKMFKDIYDEWIQRWSSQWQFSSCNVSHITRASVLQPNSAASCFLFIWHNSFKFFTFLVTLSTFFMLIPGSFNKNNIWISAIPFIYTIESQPVRIGFLVALFHRFQKLGCSVWARGTHEPQLLETQGQPYQSMLTIGGKARALKMPLHMQCVYLIKLDQQYWLGIPTGHIIALVIKSSRFQRCNEIWNGPQFPATKCDHQPGKKDNAIIIQSIRPCRFLQDFEYTKPHSY